MADWIDIVEETAKLKMLRKYKAPKRMIETQERILRNAKASVRRKSKGKQK